MEPFAFNIGIDWGCEEHAVCTQSALGAVIREWKIAHSGEGHQQLLNWLLKLSGGDPSSPARRGREQLSENVTELADQGT